MKVLRIRDVKLPSRGTEFSAGIDIFIPNELLIKDDDEYLEIPSGKIELRPGESVLIPSGLKVNVPENHVLIAFNKSGVAAKKNLIVGACVIDEDYQGEIHIDIKNVGKTSQVIYAGEKITQLLCLPINYVDIEEVSSLDELYQGKITTRGQGGFGSTGTR